MDKGLFRAMSQMLVDLGQPGGCPARMACPLGLAAIATAAFSALSPRACLLGGPARVQAAAGRSDWLAPWHSAAWRHAVYCEDFEVPFLERTAEFYRAEVRAGISQGDAS